MKRGASRALAGLKGTFGRGGSATALGRAVQRPPLNDARRSADDDCDTAGSAGPGPSRQPPRRPSPPPRPPRLCCGAASPPPAAALPSPARRRLEREGKKKILPSPLPARLENQPCFLRNRSCCERRTRQAALRHAQMCLCAAGPGPPARPSRRCAAPRQCRAAPRPALLSRGLRAGGTLGRTSAGNLET